MDGTPVGEATGPEPTPLDPEAEGPPTVRRTATKRQHLIGFGVYLAAALALYGFRVLPDPTHRLLGGLSSDADFSVWALRWWPWAVAHGSNPFVSTRVWAPTGYSVAWSTSVPVASLAAGPVTAAFGPVATFNLLSVLAAPFSAWTAYLLCRRVTGSFLPSLAGGFVFGFSPFLINTLALGHLDLSLAVFVPLIVYLVVRRLEGSIRPRWFVGLLGLTLALQFGVFPEVSATLTLVGGLALLLAVAFAPGSRRTLLRTVGWIALAYGVAALLLTPFIYALVTYPHPVRHLHPISDLAYFAEHLDAFARFVVPGRAQALGGGRIALAGIEGNGSYFGVPLLVILGIFFVTQWRRPVTKVLAVIFVLTALLSLGPSVLVAGHVVPLPWRAVEILPLFRRAVPSRLIMYTYLVAGISLAMWVSARPRWTRWVPAAVAAFLLLPSASGSLWTGRVDTPPFFASGQYRRYLSPDETIALIGPRKGAQMLWQAQSGMAFRLVGGYLGSIPADYQGAGLVAKLTTGQAPPSVLRSFLAAHRVGAVVVAGEAVPPRLAAALGVQPLSVGGVELFQLAPAGG